MHFVWVITFIHHAIPIYTQKGISSPQLVL